MIFRPLFDSHSSTYTYLLADTHSRQATIVDPVREHTPRDRGLLTELGLKLVYILETHVHADHDSITRRLFILPEDTLMYPGHDYRGRRASAIAAVKTTNPRLAGKTRDQLIEIMNNLDLPMPGKIGEPISANLRGGKIDG